MLNRTSIPTPNARTAWGAVLRGLFAGPSAWLIRLALITVVVSLLMCVYLWQVTTIQDIETDTRDIQQKIDQLEHDNVTLMLQLAQWNHPAFIERTARQQGLTPGKAPLVMHVPLAAEPRGPGEATTDVPAWQQLIRRLPKPPVLMHIQTWMR